MLRLLLRQRDERDAFVLTPRGSFDIVKKDPGQANDRLISGKLRAKAGRTGAAHTTITVDGAEYVWSYRHGWVVWGKGIKAVSVSVSLHPERTRELILDFTVKANEGGGTPSDARVLDALPSAIRSALKAGWEPESRGRAFRHEISESI
jgi:hypothetical protein